MKPYQQDLLPEKHPDGLGQDHHPGFVCQTDEMGSFCYTDIMCRHVDVMSTH